MTDGVPRTEYDNSTESPSTTLADFGFRSKTGGAYDVDVSRLPLAVACDKSASGDATSNSGADVAGNDRRDVEDRKMVDVVDRHDDVTDGESSSAVNWMPFWRDVANVDEDGDLTVSDVRAMHRSPSIDCDA